MLNCGDIPEGPGALPGLERIRSFSLFNAGRISIRSLLPYNELEELRVTGPPGRVTDLDSLVLFPRLQTLTLRDCYELQAAEMPPAAAFPSLKSVMIDGIRVAGAALVAAPWGKRSASRYGANAPTHGCEPTWPTPLREWPDEHGARVGNAAMATYRKAAAAMERAANLEATREALHSFMATINRIAAKIPFDTIQREQVMDAFDELAALAGDALPSATVDTWFEEWDDT
jgi:hypothetical protein